jgi:hypothetical protein
MENLLVDNDYEKMLKEEVEAYYDWNDEKNHKIAQDTRCPC